MNFNRETILAIVAGFAVGLLAAWIVWSLPRFFPKKETPIIKEEKTASSPAESFILEVSEPENEAISQTDKIKVSGKTQTGATVVISGSLGEEVIEATEGGKFSATVGLEEGLNEIKITAYAGTGSEEKSEIRTVNYTKEEF